MATYQIEVMSTEVLTENFITSLMLETVIFFQNLILFCMSLPFKKN